MAGGIAGSSESLHQNIVYDSVLQQNSSPIPRSTSVEPATILDSNHQGDALVFS
jgi:hypothetical protein